MSSNDYPEHGTQTDLRRQLEVIYKILRYSQNRHTRLVQEFNEAYRLYNMGIVRLEVLEAIENKMIQNANFMGSIVSNLEALQIKSGNRFFSKTEVVLIEKSIEYLESSNSKN